MKTRILLSVILLTATALAPAATNDLTATLQKGLFEEEANHNIAAAILAYQAVVNQFDKDRKLAATAVFRLAECYRKQGATNEATAQYERVLREFADQTQLLASSHQSLALLGVAPGTRSAPITVGGADPEQQEIRRIEQLLQDSPDLINAPGKNGETLLQAAAAKGQLSVVQTLLNWGAGVSVNRPSNLSPLHYAAGNGHKSVVDLLIQRGAKLDAETDSGVMPLHLATLKSYTLVAKALIGAGAPLNARVRQSVSRSEEDLQYGFAGGESPLDLAIANNSEEIAALLVDAKADVNSGSPLLKAAVRGEKSIVALLLDHGAEVAGTDGNGDTALHLAASNGNPELVALLLARGADINAGNKSGATPLHAAAAAGNGAIVEALLAKGADINRQDDSGSTPLCFAVRQGKVDAARVLLVHKADPNIKYSDGFPPLYAALSRGDTESVRSLLEAGADPDSKTPDGKSPVMLAIERRDKSALELLLAHKANVNARDPQGNTALHFLAFSPMRLPATPVLPSIPPRQGLSTTEAGSALAELLLAAGADVNAQNNEGKTPLQYALQYAANSAQRELAAVLRKHGALENPPDFSSIRVTRRGLKSPVFFRSDTNGINQFTLAEALLNCFGQPHPSLLPFPDLSRITINRYTKNKPTDRKEIIVNMLNATNGIDCTKDIPLQFGDEIDIPEREHALSESPVGLTETQWSDLKSCVKRKVTFVIKDQRTEVTLFGDQSMYLANAVNFSKVQSVLRSSSDLSNIRIRRTDPITGEVKEFVRSELGQRVWDDLWLRDGDVIEVPDKP